MIPVLAVRDPVSACRTLADQFGFVQGPHGRMAFGTTQITVVSSDALPSALIRLRLDHVAFHVAAVDEIYETFCRAGAVPDPSFTPDGPRDIPQFWDHGVRFIFFQGPGAAPFEFCTRTNASAGVERGHDHFAIRAFELDAAEARVGLLGGRRIAEHSLPAVTRSVSVRFVQTGPVVFELFDEPPFAANTPATGWVGLMPDGA